MTERRRRKAYTRRVETAAKGLLGRGGFGEDACPDPDDPLHVGVAARLALIVAGNSDPALLLSRARDTERVEKQLRLLREAVRTVREWAPADADTFLLGDIALPVRCHGKPHV